MSETRIYRCDYYSVRAPSRSCLFCEHNTYVLWDYSNGPYMFLCDVGADTDEGAVGMCERFEEEVANCGDAQSCVPQIRTHGVS